MNLIWIIIIIYLRVKQNKFNEHSFIKCFLIYSIFNDDFDTALVANYNNPLQFLKTN